MPMILLLGSTSFVLSLILTPVCRNLFRRLGVTDRPGEERRIHVTPIPRIGGIPLLISFASSLALILLGPGQIALGPGMMLVWRLLPPAILVFLIGLRPWQKLSAELVAAAWAYAAGVKVYGFAGFAAADWWSVPLTLFWLVLCTNAFNLIDGVDGLAAGAGLFATLTMLVAALVQNNVPLALATIPLAGSLTGFLRYNFNPATVFLGDSGSLLIGFLLGCYGVIWSQKTATFLGMVAPMMALFVPLLDVGLSVARRFLRGQPIFAADRGHIHHRLLDRGMTPRRAVLLLYAFCTVAAVFSLVQTMVRQQYVGLVVLLFCGAAWIGIQHLGYAEFGIARSVVFGGVFGRLIDLHVQLRRFEVALESADSLEEIWKVLKAGCRDFGFAGVRMRVNGEVFEQTPVAAGGNSFWAVRIDFAGGNYVNLIRECCSPSQATILGPLVDIIRNKLGEKLPAVVETCGTIAGYKS